MLDRQPPDEWIEAANCLATVARTLSSVVHEANNMLQVIAGSAEMMQMQGQGQPASAVPSVVRRAEIIADHAHRVSALLGNVRDLSKCQPRRDGEKTDLRKAIDTVIDMRRHALTRGRIAITVEAQDAAIPVRAGWRPVMQLLLNLMLNAEQAVDDRQGAAITIAVTRDAESVLLTLRDNGVGLPQVQPEPFALHELSDTAPLLGLGLVAARRLAANEGGSLDLQSTGDGTTASLRLKAG